MAAEPEAVRRVRMWRGVAFATGSVVLFASFTLASRFGLRTEYEAADLALLRFGIAALLFLPLLLRKGLAGLSLTRALALAGCGGLGFALLAYQGIGLTPSSHAAVLLHGTLPLFGYACGALILGERACTARLAGVLLIASGMGLTLASTMLYRATISPVGDLCLIAASAAWTLYGALLTRWRVKAADAVAVVAGLSFIAFGLYALASGHVLHAVPSIEFGAQALIQGVLLGGVSLYVYSKAVEALGATGAALAATAVPIVTVLGAIPLLGEVPTRLEWAGVALSVLGMSAALAWKPGNRSSG